MPREHVSSARPSTLSRGGPGRHLIVGPSPEVTVSHPLRPHALRVALLLAALFAVLLPARSARATNIVGGNIINQTWSPAGNPYVVQGDITVPSGAFLTIQAGTIVQLASV